MGPSKALSTAFMSRGPVSLAPRLKARLSCRVRTPRRGGKRGAPVSGTRFADERAEQVSFLTGVRNLPS